MQRGQAYIGCHLIARYLAEKNNASVLQVTAALLCGHIMSGCDTVSYPFRREKKKAFKVAMAGFQDLLDMINFGDSDVEITDDVTAASLLFMLMLYGRTNGSLDEARAHAYSTTKGDLRCLPPTEDAFYFHMLRALYQIIICKTACSSNQILPRLVGISRMVSLSLS